MFRADAGHTGVYRTAAPKSLAVRWTFPTRGAVISSPVVAGGTVYVGSSDNHLYAIDAATGQEFWDFDAHGDVNSTPAVAGDVVLTLSRDGNLYALNAETGRLKWKFATAGERRHTARGIEYLSPATETMPDPWDFFLSSPTVANDTVYFGSGDGNVYAVALATGELRWKFQTNNVVHASPAVVDGRVFIGSFDRFFYALDAANGALLWRFQTGSDERAHLMTGIPGSAAVSNGVVFFGCRDAHVYALDAATGRQLWKHQTDSSWVVASPAVCNDLVCYATSDSLKFEILAAKTGELRHAIATDLYGFSSAAVAEGVAYFGTFDGKLHAVNLASGASVGEFTVPGLAENRARYVDASGKIRLDAVWISETLDDAIVSIHTRLFSLGSILSSPAVSDGVIYFGSVDGNIYALGAPLR